VLCIVYSVSQILGHRIVGFVMKQPFPLERLPEFIVPGLLTAALGVYLMMGGGLLVDLAFRNDSPGSENQS
jgi:hypothetical protein